MKKLATISALLLCAGCAGNPNRDNWNQFAEKNDCIATGKQKVLLAGSVYSIPQRRIVYEFKCGNQIVWSDLGAYAKYNEWLSI